MARTTYLCVKSQPEMRPSMSEAELRASVFETIEEEDGSIENEEGLLPALLGSCNDCAKQLHASPSGILFSTKKHPKTKDLMPEDFWVTARKKKIVVFALPGEPGVTELVGDFKIHFHGRQGDFYCWLNTTMTENRKILDSSDLDGFDKRRVPSPGFQVEVVMIDYDETISGAR